MLQRMPSSEHLVGKILVPLDGSPLAERAIPYAEELARALKTEVQLFQVALPIRGMLLSSTNLASPEETMALVQERVTQYFSGLTAKLGSSGPKVQFQISNLPAVDWELEEVRTHLLEMIVSLILQRVAEPDIGIVVLASHGSGARKGTAYGGVASRVLARCPKPVLVVRVINEAG